MPSVVINPGSGPARGATVGRAAFNIKRFVADLVERGHQNVTCERRPDADYDHKDSDGRFCWLVGADGLEPVEVQMPGLPLEQVRWLGPDQDIWQFPRLYVDDSSWIWFFALNQFIPEDQDAPSPNNTLAGGEPYRFTHLT